MDDRRDTAQVRARAPRAKGLVRHAASTFVGAAAWCAMTALAASAMADTAAAEQMFASGIRAFDKKDYKTAVEDFSRAYAEAPRTTYLWNLAVAEMQAGSALAALAHFRTYKAAPDAAQADLQAVDGLIARLSASVGHVVVVAPAGFAVTVDGATEGVAPLASAVDVEPDVEHRVVAQQGSYHLDATVHVERSETRRVSLLLADSSSPAQPPAIDAARVAPPPGPIATPPTTAASAGGSNATRNIVVISTASAALVATGLGVTFGLMSQTDNNNFHAAQAAVDQQAAQSHVPASSACYLHPTWASCVTLQNRLQQLPTNASAANAFYIAAGVLGVASVATFLFWPKPSADHAAWLVPQLGPGFGGVALGASF